jgi:DNA polymerase V
MDTINKKMGKGSVGVAAAGVRMGWEMKREKKSPNFTSDWGELPVAG